MSSQARNAWRSKKISVVFGFPFFYFVFMFFCVVLCLVDGYHPDADGVPAWNEYHFHSYPNPRQLRKTNEPKDVMVDVVNNMGLKLLSIHNENNDNNIALSPYGALSVLIALGEALQGDAVREIQQAASIPNDISTIRVGLRDIHRHLKSYFIPKEGFLAGLTLNHENVTLRSEYEDILKYYGYDTMAFNNALFPDPETTDKSIPKDQPMEPPVTITEPPEVPTVVFVAVGKDEPEVPTTTESLPPTSHPDESTGYFDDKPEVPVDLTTVSEEFTTETKFTTHPTTSRTFTTTPTFMTMSTFMTTPSTVSTHFPDSTSETTGMTTTSTMDTTKTETVPDTTIMTTTHEPSTMSDTTMSGSTQTGTSTMPTPEVTLSSTITTTVLPSSETTTRGTTTVETSSTMTSGSTTILPSSETTTRGTTITTTETSPTMTSGSTTMLPSSETTTSGTTITTTGTSSTMTSDSTTMLPSSETTTSGTTITTTETSSTMTSGSTTMLPSSETTTSGTTVTTFSTTSTGSTTMSSSGSTGTVQSSTITTDISTSTSTSTSIGLSTKLETSGITSEATAVSSPETSDSENEIMSTGNSEGFAGALRRNSHFRSENLVELNMIHSENANRKSRSIVDYIIARYYDDRYDSLRPNRRPFIPVDQPSFLVYGKYREYNIDFMRYDTVLPFYYIPHLDTLALRFPLDNANYYLLLLLPVDEHGIDQLICNLRFNGSLRYIIGNLRHQHVIATIPSFMMKGYVTLTPTLQKLGVRKVFEPRQADFTPMTSEKGIYVTNIEQAITVNIRNYLDPNSPTLRRDLHQYSAVEFKADHPFLYFVLDSQLQVTLMAGKVINPLNSRIR